MKKIGLLIPNTNLTVEYELQFLYENKCLKINKVCFYTTKLETKTKYKEDKEKYLNELAKNSLLKIKELNYLDVDYTAFFCTTSAVLSKDQDILNNPAEALVEASMYCGINKCLLITPYSNKLGCNIKEYLENERIVVDTVINLDLINTKDYFDFGIEKLEDLIFENYKSEYENIIISCTNLPTLHLISKLEKKLNTKIISSNSSLLWKILKENDIKLENNMLGVLYESTNE